MTAFYFKRYKLVKNCIIIVNNVGIQEFHLFFDQLNINDSMSIDDIKY